jgi:hypothetical protein
MPILSIRVRWGRAIGWVCKPEVTGSIPVRSISRKNLFAGCSSARFPPSATAVRARCERTADSCRAQLSEVESEAFVDRSRVTSSMRRRSYTPGVAASGSAVLVKPPANRTFCRLGVGADDRRSPRTGIHAQMIREPFESVWAEELHHQATSRKVQLNVGLFTQAELLQLGDPDADPRRGGPSRRLATKQHSTPQSRPLRSRRETSQHDPRQCLA